MGEDPMSEFFRNYLCNYLWTGMDYIAAIFLFDAFSQRKRKNAAHWKIVAAFVLLTATFLNTAYLVTASSWKELFVVGMFYFLHRLLYRGNRIFSLYFAVIFCAIPCCVDNLMFTFSFLLAKINVYATHNVGISLTFLEHYAIGMVCYLQKTQRKHRHAQTENWRWYSVPAVLSAVSVLLILLFRVFFQNEQISSLPLFVCASFIICMQIAALLLVSRMEQNAHFREETIALQTKSNAQQESIEALSAAYAQQRKLSHDFRAHLDTLAAMLSQENCDIGMMQTYLHGLQTEQTKRLLLVNTHHTALDALLNQKALMAKNRGIDIQFRVNDLSAVTINLVDLTVIISNTLDNAIEACEKLPAADRQIYVQLLLEDGELFYGVRNRTLPVDLLPGRLPATTKEDPSYHGYGLQNVQTTLKKYHSVYALNYENGWFEFSTDFLNTSIS